LRLPLIGIDEAPQIDCFTPTSGCAIGYVEVAIAESIGTIASGEYQSFTIL